MVCFDEVATTKAFSTRSLKQLVVLQNDEAGPTITSLDEAAFTLTMLIPILTGG